MAASCLLMHFALEPFFQYRAAQLTWCIDSSDFAKRQSFQYRSMLSIKVCNYTQSIVRTQCTFLVIVLIDDDKWVATMAILVMFNQFVVSANCFSVAMIACGVFNSKILEWPHWGGLTMSCQPMQINIFGSIKRLNPVICIMAMYTTVLDQLGGLFWALRLMLFKNTKGKSEGERFIKYCIQSTKSSYLLSLF